MKLEAKALEFGYPGKRVGHGVDFELGPGECFCFLGANGSGKTTLFRTLLGLLPPRGGEVRLDGRRVGDLGIEERARLMAYVPQAQRPTLPFSVLDVVLMGRAARLGVFSAPSRRDVEVALESLRSLEIEDLAPEPITRLSGGQQQLAVIARALAQEPRVLVLDEPTASLDYGNQVRLLRRIRELASRGIALVISTHDPGHAFACGTRVGLLHGGTLMASGPPASVITTDSLKTLYGVNLEVRELPGDRDGERRSCVVLDYQA